MKKYLLLIGTVVILVSGCKTLALEYGCSYTENGSWYGFEYMPGQTVEQYCAPWCNINFDNDFQKNSCNKCKTQDYPLALRAYKSGACKKIMPPKVFNNVEGCTCKITTLEDGSIWSRKSACFNNKGYCDNAMEKVKLMLKEGK